MKRKEKLELLSKAQDGNDLLLIAQAIQIIDLDYHVLDPIPYYSHPITICKVK